MSQERSPLLLENHHQPLQEVTSSIPNFPTYGAENLEAPRRSRFAKLTQGGLASIPLIAIIAVGVSVVLICSFTYFNKVGENGTIILRQQAPEKQENSDHIDIRIPQGLLRGYVRKSRQGSEYLAFYKVPYASPPLGQLRFKDPEPPTHWRGLRDTPHVAPQCIQKEKYPTPPGANITVGEEDCLYSNIYVPHARNFSTSLTYPVMVYIHGGGTTGNGSRYGAEYMMDEDIILVTFQFRLGALGTLNTNDNVIRGNMGNKDQVQMLRYVRDNIGHFGGDPERVTIFGNSGGGIAVGYLVASPMANGLFHRAIIQSGGTLCTPPMDTTTGKQGTVEEVGRVLNCPTQDSQQFLDCLNTKSASDIALVVTLKAVYSLTIEDRENPADNSVFMPDTPFNILDQGRAAKVPVILGNVNAEWIGTALSFLQDTELVDNLNADFVRFAKYLVPGTTVSDEEFLRMKQVYFGNAEIGNGTFTQLSDLISDRALVHCNYQTAKMHAKNGDASSAYLYWLTKPPAKSYVEKSHPEFKAREFGLVHHADELQFLFPYYGYPEIPEGDPDYYEFSRYFVKLWAHFATTGQARFNGAEWRRVDPENTDNIVWMELGDKFQETSIILERMQFWDQFTPQQLMYA